MSALPTFFVIGAAKAGTTALHAALDRHPDIAMSSVKEPRFFVADPGQTVLAASGRVADRRAYEELFDAAAPQRGESSTSYSLFPLYDGVPGRISSVVPDARFVYLVRDPVARALSHFQQAFFSGTALEDVETAFANPALPRHPYVCGSRYATQVERFLAVFPDDRLLVLDSGQLAVDPRAVVERVAALLGLPTGRTPAGAAERHNVTAGKRRESPWLARLRGAGAAARVPAPLRRPARAAARALLSRETPPPTPSATAIERLREHLAPEAERLRAFTGARYEHWTV